MKLVLLFCFITLFSWWGGHSKQPRAASTISSASPENHADTISFTNQVQPILVKECSPCHFTGGKMYERMPFDKDTTIVNHEKGILKRFNGDDKTVIKAFIEQNKTH